MLTVRQAADQLQVSRSIVYALIDAGKLACHRIGLGRGTIRISQADLDAYLGSCKTRKPEVRDHKLRHIEL